MATEVCIDIMCEVFSVVLGERGFTFWDNVVNLHLRDCPKIFLKRLLADF